MPIRCPNTRLSLQVSEYFFCMERPKWGNLCCVGIYCEMNFLKDYRSFKAIVLLIVVGLLPFGLQGQANEQGNW